MSYVFDIFVNNMHTICANMTLKKEKQTNKETKINMSIEREKKLQGMYFSIPLLTFGIFCVQNKEHAKNLKSICIFSQVIIKKILVK